MNYKRSYVTEEAGRCLFTYKYAGSDKSISYNYCWRHISDLIVKFLPVWIAPNVITLVALIIRIACDVWVAYYAWDMAGSIPRVPCIVFALGYFAYIILDSVDGKQARKTGNSSPLGLMFDHGADSINTVSLSISLVCLVGVGQTWYFPLVLLGLITGFFFATLEEYYCQRLDLGVINGVSDGCLMIYAIGILSGIYGVELWTMEVFNGWSLIDMVCFVFFICSVLTAMGSVLNIMGSKAKLSDMFLRSSTFIALNVTFLVHYKFTSLSNWYLRILTIAYGLMNCELISHIMLAHITSQVFNPFRPTIVASCAVVCLYFFSPLKLQVPEAVLLWGLFLLCLASYLEFIISVSNELTTILGIRMFKVKKLTKCS
eukprot:TRINITY_DN448_c0_g1_i18.p1 TRINITY_DN448_c0_g1~~TRINITY_DN448_c0_g1_i18.p1  ORF type:complete len:373 (-),score=71.90 TRINITY_DN448_c0_g1_i18:64-1182(-)